MKIQHLTTTLLPMIAALVSAPLAAICPPLSQATEIDVTSCGADGSDAAADDVAIQDAIDQAQTLGARVVFPAGTYILSTSGVAISSSVDLVGQGADLSVIERRSPAFTAVRIQDATGVRLRDLGFRDDSPHANRFLVAAGIESFTIEACRFSNIGSVAVRIDEARDVRISRSTFDEITGSAIFFADPGEGRSSERVWIFDNRFYRTNTSLNQFHAAINLDFVTDVSGPAPEERFRSFQVVRNHIEETGASGIRLKAYRSIVAFNILDQGELGTFDEGITFFGSQNAIYGNLVTGFWAHGILMWVNDHQSTGQPHRDNLIASNVVWDNGASGIAAALSEERSHVENLKIAGNLLVETPAGKGQNWGVNVGDFNHDPNAPPLVDVSLNNVSIQGNSAYGHLSGAFDIAERRGGVHLGSNDEDTGATRLAVEATAILGSSSLAAGLAIVRWQTPAVDDDGFFNPLNPSRLTIREPGVYAVSCSLDWAPNGSGHRTAAVRRNATTVIARSRVAHAGGSVPVPVAAHTVQRLEAGDWLECLAQHNSSAGSLAVQAGSLTFFRLVKVES